MVSSFKESYLPLIIIVISSSSGGGGGGGDGGGGGGGGSGDGGGGSSSKLCFIRRLSDFQSDQTSPHNSPRSVGRNSKVMCT